MIKVTCNTKDSLDISELTEFQGDLKHRDENDVQKIIKSIKKHGFAFPFFVWNHDGINHVFDGHGRLLALKKLQDEGEEIPELPVVYINAENEAEAKEMLLKLNSNYGHMTVDSVMEFLDGINIDFNDIELPDTELNFDTDEPDETEGDDECPEVSDEEPVSQLGEIYQLGDSLLMCGDSTKEEDVARLMGGVKADMVFTDPPYSYEYQSNMRTKTQKFDVIKNDDKVLDFFPLVKNFNKGFVFICTTWKVLEKWIPLFNQYYDMSNMVIWDKGGGGMGNLSKTFLTDYEIILVANNDAQILGKRIGSVWKIGKDNANKYVHPTQKPVELAKLAIEETTKREDIILDFFGGSGSTLIACEKLNRKARLMELDPHYCDVIRKRYTQWAKENGRPITSGCLE